MMASTSGESGSYSPSKAVTALKWAVREMEGRIATWQDRSQEHHRPIRLAEGVAANEVLTARTDRI